MLSRGTGTIPRVRVGILGGTFDPPHVAHVELADAARDQWHLDRVLLMVAGDPWQKRGEVAAGMRERLAMVEALVAGHADLEVSAMEVERPGPSYTVDTLEALGQDGDELFLIVGADVAAGLHTWHRSERVKELATVLVADRPGALPASDLVGALGAQGWRCGVVDLPFHDVSSTDVRERLAAGDAVAGLVPAPVVRVVEEHGLYTRP